MTKKASYKARADGVEESKERELTVEDKKLLQQSLIQEADQKVQEKFSDKSLDRHLTKIELLSGEIIDLNELNVVSSSLHTYVPRFVNDYYVQIFRLNGWDIPENGIINEKPHIVGKWTKEIVYGRFNKQVLPTLEHLNPYVRIGLRRHKHHQYLNEDGLKKLNIFIEEAISLMKSMSSWYEFRIKLYEEYGVQYQTDMFQEKFK